MYAPSDEKAGHRAKSSIICGLKAFDHNFGPCCAARNGTTVIAEAVFKYIFSLSFYSTENPSLLEEIHGKSV
jgi:hypothetical protein